ncbi:MAG TPA: hypothetical protein VN688_20935 [Gemmataceae bacterium]|nr:hypothetical protein [Gemmataceae bacterium]
MIEHPQPIISPLVVAAATITPAPDLSPGETVQPLPTVDQAEAVDQVFTSTPVRHPAATLLGVLTSVALLRDVAVDTFDTSGEDKQAEQDADEDEDADSTD